MSLATVAVTVLGGRALVSALSSGDPQASVRSAPPTPTSTVAGPIIDCSAGNLALSIGLERTEYTVGEHIPITVTMAHRGRSCLVDGSDKGRQVIITSGTDRIWSTADCPGPGRSLLLASGDTDVSVVTWPGGRSEEGCPEGLPALGAGTYSVAVTVPGADGATSEAVPFTLVAPAPPPADVPAP